MVCRCFASACFVMMVLTHAGLPALAEETAGAERQQITDVLDRIEKGKWVSQDDLGALVRNHPKAFIAVVCEQHLKVKTLERMRAHANVLSEHPDEMIGLIRKAIASRDPKVMDKALGLVSIAHIGRSCDVLIDEIVRVMDTVKGPGGVWQADMSLVEIGRFYPDKVVPHMMTFIRRKEVRRPRGKLPTGLDARAIQVMGFLGVPSKAAADEMIALAKKYPLMAQDVAFALAGSPWDGPEVVALLKRLVDSTGTIARGRAWLGLARRVPEERLGLDLALKYLVEEKGGRNRRYNSLDNYSAKLILTLPLSAEWEQRVLARVRPLLKLDEPHICVFAATVILKLRPDDAEAVAALVEMIPDGPDKDTGFYRNARYAAEAAAMLGAVGEPARRAVPKLKKLVEAKNDYLPIAAKVALSQLAPEEHPFPTEEVRRMLRSGKYTPSYAVHQVVQRCPEPFERLCAEIAKGLAGGIAMPNRSVLAIGKRSPALIAFLDEVRRTTKVGSAYASMAGLKTKLMSFPEVTDEQLGFVAGPGERK